MQNVPYPEETEQFYNGTYLGTATKLLKGIAQADANKV